MKIIKILFIFFLLIIFFNMLGQDIVGEFHLWPYFKGDNYFSGITAFQVNSSNPWVKNSYRVVLSDSQWVTASPVIDANGCAYVGTNPSKHYFKWSPDLTKATFFKVNPPYKPGPWLKRVNIPYGNSGQDRYLGFRLASAIGNSGHIFGYCGASEDYPRLYCFDPDNLDTLCHYELPSSHYHRIGFANVNTKICGDKEMIYFGDEDGFIYGLSFNDDVIPWTFMQEFERRIIDSCPINMNGILVDPDPSQDKIYVGATGLFRAGRAIISCRRATTGVQRWAVSLPATEFGGYTFLESSATIANGPELGKRTLYVGTASAGVSSPDDGGFLCAIDINDDDHGIRFMWNDTYNPDMEIWHSPTVVSVNGVNVIFFGINWGAVAIEKEIVDFADRPDRPEMVKPGKVYAILDDGETAPQVVLTRTLNTTRIINEDGFWSPWAPTRKIYAEISSSVIVVPVARVPGNPYKYYLFFTDNLGFLNCFKFSIPDHAPPYILDEVVFEKLWDYDLFNGYYEGRVEEMAYSMYMPTVNQSTPAVFYDEGYVRLVVCGYLQRWIWVEGFPTWRQVCTEKTGARMFWVTLAGMTPIRIPKSSVLKGGEGGKMGSEIEDLLPKAFVLYQNMPNPFTTHTTIKYTLPKDEYVNLKVYDMTGRIVRILVMEQQSAGYYDVIWDGKDDRGNPLITGIYFCKIKAGEFSKTEKLVLMK